MLENWSISGVDLHLELPPRGGRRAALEGALRDAVRAGRLPPGARLPSTRLLAADLGLSRGTVSAAYDQLAAEGFLHARVGSGTVVADLSGVRPRDEAEKGPREPSQPRYDLRPGRPDMTAFPTAAWLRSARSALATAPPAAYGYGDPRGQAELRTALADYLGRARGVVADPDRIVVTSGYVQALGLLAAVLGAGAPIAMEEPCLGVHREVVRRAGADVRALAIDGRGARTDLLGVGELGEVAAAVVTPAHQFPMGVPLHPSRRRAAVEWARGTGGVVVEDDYDGEFRYDRQPVGALQGFAPDRVVYAGTVSKTLGPGLRLGWVVLPRRLVEPVVEAKRHADWHTESIGQLTLAELINRHGYDRHVRAMRLRYRRRRDLLTVRIRSAVLRHFSIGGMAAGLHAVVHIAASGPDEREVLVRAAARGLALAGLGEHWQRPGRRPKGLIVGFGAARESAYPAAVSALVSVLRETDGPHPQVGSSSRAAK